MSKYNFSAGPAILPRPVIEEASRGVLDIQGIGLSILEISHRGPEVVSIMNEAETLLRELYEISDDYSVLFLTGGASSQFFMVPMNLLSSNETAGYLDTGTWSSKAIKEAKKFGKIDVIASSKDQQYSYISKEYAKVDNLRYCHLTTNNTIYGTQYDTIPNLGIPLVGDSSSDFLSKPLDINKFDVLFAGAQKNLGPAGVTVVIVKNEILGKVERDIPSMLDYRTHIEKKSSFNTPPVFPIYVCMLTMRWLKELGGLQVMAKRNSEKAALLYSEIDRNSIFKGVARKEDRSKMNVTFVTEKEENKIHFLDLCEKAGITGIKGHRSVGGFRASIYNAMDIQGVQKLIEVMQDFEQSNA